MLNVLFILFSNVGGAVGVQDLKFRQAEELISQGHSLTTKFKTAATYGYQPVSLSKISLELFKIYLSSFRPFASGGKCDRPDDSLWLRLDGNPEIGIGRYVKMFYSSACNLHITTTRMRSLTETVANDLHEVILVTCLLRSSWGYLLYCAL